MLQEAGLPVSAVNLPVQAGQPPRVAMILANVVYEAGRFMLVDTGKEIQP